MNTEINKVITKIEETAEKNRFCKNKINLSIKDNEVFIDEMRLEGWAKGGKSMLVEYHDISFADMLKDLLSRFDNYDLHLLRGTSYDTRYMYIYRDCKEEQEHLGNLYLTLKNLMQTILETNRA